MEHSNTTPIPEAASAPAAILHPNQSPPPSPATSAPHSNRPPKRKLNTEHEQTYKRRQLDPPSASTSVKSEESRTPCQASQDKQDQRAQLEGGFDRVNEASHRGISRDKFLGAQGYSRDHGRGAQQITQDHDPSIRQESRNNISDNGKHEGEDTPTQPSIAPLSKANLKLLQQEVTASEEMDNGSTSSSQIRKRRAPSRQTSNSDLVSGTSGQTKEPTPSQSFYRYRILAQAKVYIRPEPPPGRAQAQLDIIFERKVKDNRRREISDIAKRKSPEFSNLLRVARREDDLVELFHQVLLAMQFSERLTHLRKA
ncbi:MAG: hypothetical protein Q9183_006219, partial [Haloplaca sp. 2 TL-2023]